jgi:DNA-binding IclR family transcriptional regulator
VRKRGYAVSVQETNEHLAALAWPVRDVSGAVHAALGIALPMVRLSPERREALLRELKRTAGEIEKLWGCCRAPGK